MIFVDTNVLMYAVGRAHPRRAEAEAFFESALRAGTPLATSAEVLQELLHAYLQSDRMATLDAALDMIDALFGTIWPVEAEDVRFARALAVRHPELEARDLVHLACCRRREVDDVKTFDRPLAAAFRRK